MLIALQTIEAKSKKGKSPKIIDENKNSTPAKEPNKTEKVTSSPATAKVASKGKSGSGKNHLRRIGVLVYCLH